MANPRPSEKALRGMANWYERHATAFCGSNDPSIIKMRESHTKTACRLRAEALVRKWQSDCQPMADPTDLQELENRIAYELRDVQQLPSQEKKDG